MTLGGAQLYRVPHESKEPAQAFASRVTPLQSDKIREAIEVKFGTLHGHFGLLEQSLYFSTRAFNSCGIFLDFYCAPDSAGTLLDLYCMSNSARILLEFYCASNSARTLLDFHCMSY